MKNYLWIFVIAGMGVLGCGDDTPSSDGNETTSSEIEIPPADNRPNQGKNGSFLPPLQQEETPMVTTLTTDYWVFEFYVVDDKSRRTANKGRWFNFHPDGTYESGIWENETGYGSWRIQQEPEGTMLYLDNINDTQDEKWEIQGVNDAKDTMTWAGISETPNAGVITKAINLLTKPTKQQFGVE
jgi:hypothetical protein